jgi:hypothetical protein
VNNFVFLHECATNPAHPNFLAGSSDDYTLTGKFYFASSFQPSIFKKIPVYSTSAAVFYMPFTSSFYQRPNAHALPGFPGWYVSSSMHGKSVN